MKHDFDNPINLPIKIEEGCKGCGGRWHSTDFHEGQCLKCKRCLDCCGSKRVKFSCAWQYERKWGRANLGKRVEHERRSKIARDNYERNPYVLYERRRLF